MPTMNGREFVLTGVPARGYTAWEDAPCDRCARRSACTIRRQMQLCDPEWDCGVLHNVNTLSSFWPNGHWVDKLDYAVQILES